MAAATTSFATNDLPVFSIKNLGEKTFYLETKDMISNYAEVMIQNAEGEVLFSEYIVNTTTFERNYNLSELATGTYFLIVKSETKTQKFPLYLNEKNLEMDWAELETL